MNVKKFHVRGEKIISNSMETTRSSTIPFKMNTTSASYGETTQKKRKKIFFMKAICVMVTFLRLKRATWL